MIKVSIDGHLHDEKDAVISVFDRGFLYGDSVYEVMRTSGDYLVGRDCHLDRLEQSAHGIGLRLPSRQTLIASMETTLASFDQGDAYVRLIVTRGSGTIGLDTSLANNPRVVVIAQSLKLPPEQHYVEGVRIAIVDVRRNVKDALNPAIKSGNYLNNILALSEGKKQGAEEAIMCNTLGCIAEGSTSNIFMIKDGHISTPSAESGILKGVTRQAIMTLAHAMKQPVTESLITPDELKAADEAFLTSTIRGIIPVSHIDNKPLNAPGEVTLTLMTAYNDYLAQVATGKEP